MWYDESDLSSVKKALSLKLPEFLPNIPHADIIEEKALDLLNIPNAITLSPTLLATNKEKIYFAAGKTYRENYKINVSASAVIKCSCKGFRFSNICSHSVAVSEKEGILEKHLRKFKSSRSRSSLTYPFNAGGAGRKGGQKRRERKYQQEEIHTSNQLFSEIWHNNEAFEITLVKDIPIERNFCNYCQNEFPRFGGNRSFFFA